MRKQAVAALMATLLCGSTTAFSQEYCSDVLKLAAYNYSVDSQANSKAKKIYDEYCQGDQLKSSSNLNIGLDVVVQGVPLGFELGSGSAQDKMQTFCHKFSSDYSEHSEKYSNQRLVSESSVNAWVECLRLAERGIEFQPQTILDQVIISVRKKTADVVKVTGLSYGKENMTCTVPSDDNTEESTTGDLNTRKTLNDGSSWTIACVRKPQAFQSGKLYPQSSLAVLTSKGNLALIVPPEPIVPPQAAREISAQIVDLQKQVTELKVAPHGLDCMVKTVLGQENDGGTSAPLSLSADEVKAGYFVTGGGCEQTGRDKNAATNFSKPTDGLRGWDCASGNLPGVPVRVQNRTYLIACKLK